MKEFDKDAYIEALEKEVDRLRTKLEAKPHAIANAWSNWNSLNQYSNQTLTIGSSGSSVPFSITTPQVTGTTLTILNQQQQLAQANSNNLILAQPKKK